MVMIPETNKERFEEQTKGKTMTMVSARSVSTHFCSIDIWIDQIVSYIGFHSVSGIIMIVRTLYHRIQYFENLFAH